MAKAQIAAFDLDGTLLDGQSGTLIVRYLISHKLLAKRTTALCIWWGIRYKLHLPFRQNEVRERIFKDLGVYDPDKIHAIMEDFHNTVMLPRYRAQGVEELRRHVEAGEHVALISATFDQVAQVAREYLGCEVALATIMETDEQGRFTGAVLGETTAGDEKVRRIREWADNAFGADGWEMACAFGDHHTDVPMLEMARQPFAVDPVYLLRRVANKRGWPILAWE